MDYSPKDVEVVEIDDSNQGSGPPGRMYDEASRTNTGSGFHIGSGLNLGSGVIGSGGPSGSGGEASGSGDKGDSF